ncbi:MAG: hypothetical protein J7M14_02420, partial [Planctomycetes bacterium]|nr:hypothetical protein [Planctomycetota bacterium]
MAQSFMRFVRFVCGVATVTKLRGGDGSCGQGQDGCPTISIRLRERGSDRNDVSTSDCRGHVVNKATHFTELIYLPAVAGMLFVLGGCGFLKTDGSHLLDPTRVV